MEDFYTCLLLAVRHGQGDMRAVLDEYCRPGLCKSRLKNFEGIGISPSLMTDMLELGGTPTAHHELDGWVHTDAHDAFDLMPLGCLEGFAIYFANESK